MGKNQHVCWTLQHAILEGEEMWLQFVVLHSSPAYGLPSASGTIIVVITLA